MESEFLTFEAAEVEVIGDVFEFDEEVQRGETVRFYTLNEQMTDALEHMVPKGRTTRAQLEKLDKEVDRIRDLYETYVIPTSEGYAVHAPKIMRSFPWVSPVLSEVQHTQYSFNDEWRPLFFPGNIRQPNGYMRMLTSLPKPLIATRGQPLPITKATEFVSENGAYTVMRALPAYAMSRTRRHEDGRIDVMSVAVDGTADPAMFEGYWLRARPYPIPDPLPDHPFLASAEGRFVPSNEPLSEVIPGIDAVMMHGVPVTQDPYTEGVKFLKLYDISLDAIPWELWQQRFPKKEVVDVMPQPLELKFEEPAASPPSKNVVEQYGTPYFSGVAPRHWLMAQEDGGRLVVKMIHSLLGDAGTVANLPVSEMGDLRFPDVEEDKCTLVGLNFHDFALQGVLRQWLLDKNRESRKCIPLDIVKQERHQVGYRDRVQWTETTPQTILADYTRALARFRKPAQSERLPVYAKQPQRAVSQLRQQVVAILMDEDRFPEDKLKAITLLTRSVPHAKRQTVDTEGLFVVCDHTLAMLGGELAADRLAFYDKWTSRVDGARVCTACGEHVNNDVLVNQEDFTDEGRLLKHADALDVHTFHGESTATYTTSLRAIQSLFDMEDPSDGTMFLLISLLQLLPAQDQILPVLQEAREFSNAIKSKDRDGKARGMVGIAATALLMQVHLPRLIPRRSFGATPLKLDGFPRDTDSDKAPTVIDSLLMVLRKTFESYPTSFRGPSLAVLRGALNESAAIRKGSIAVLKRLLPKFAASLTRAKAEWAANPPPPVPVGLLPVVLPPARLGTTTGFPPCATMQTVWSDPTPPVIRQPNVPLDRNIRPRPLTRMLPATVVPTHPIQPVVPKDIQRRLRLPSIKRTEGDSWRTNLMIAQYLSSVFKLGIDTASIDTTQSPDLLRDLASGLVREIMDKIMKEPGLRREFEALRERDVSLFALLASLKESKVETNTLRAKERHLFTDRMREMSDSERQVTKDLLDRGLAPFILTNRDRDVFAAQIERELRVVEEDVPDEGVGAPRDAPDDDDRNVDEGEYGDHTVQGNRDHEQDMAPIDHDGPI